MKNRDLIILFVIFVIAIILSFSITQQSQKALSLSEKEITENGQADNMIPSADVKQVNSSLIAALPLAERGITVVSAPVIEAKDNPLQLPNKAVQARKSAANNPGLAPAEEAPEVLRPSGITEIGKRPTPKESQELNSSGVVMY
jgi:hypothetical protein